MAGITRCFGGSMLSRIKYLFHDGFFHIVSGGILVKLTAFVSSIVIVRIVEKANYGYLAYADNLYSYINLFTGLGLSTALIKFCKPSNLPGENKFYLSVALKYGVAFQLSLSVLLCIGVSIMAVPFPQARPLVYCLILFPALTQILNVCLGFVRAMQYNQLYAAMGVVQTAVILLVSVPSALIIDVYGVPFARYVAMSLAIFMGARFIRNVVPAGTKIIRPNRNEVTFFWKISISMMFANLFSMIMPLNEAFMINDFIRDEFVTANYKVATLIPYQLTFITNSIVVYVFPKIAHANKSEGKIFGYIVRIALITFGIVFSVSFLAYLFSPHIIRIVYGARFEDAIEMAKIYWIVHGLNAGFRMFPMNILPAVGSTYFNTTLSVVSCLIHFFLLRWILPNYGIYGAAYALIAIYCCSGIAYWIYLFFRIRPERKHGGSL